MPSKLQCSPSKLDRVERSKGLNQQLIDYKSFIWIYTFYSFHIMCCIQLILKTRQGGVRRDFLSSEQIGALIKAFVFSHLRMCWVLHKVTSACQTVTIFTTTIFFAAMHQCSFNLVVPSFGLEWCFTLT